MQRWIATIKLVHVLLLTFVRAVCVRVVCVFFLRNAQIVIYLRNTADWPHEIHMCVNNVSVAYS